MTVLQTLLKAAAGAEISERLPHHPPLPDSAFRSYRPGVLNLWELMPDALRWN